LVQKIELVSDQSDVGFQFCKGLGGFGSILRYQVDLSTLDEDEEGNNNHLEESEEKEEFDLDF